MLSFLPSSGDIAVGKVEAEILRTAIIRREYNFITMEGNYVNITRMIYITRNLGIRRMSVCVHLGGVSECWEPGVYKYS
ncbi:hypothetical protein I7I48_09187 [Histoplasma ohiense]|nr:hypothetical protein I7I48_09187 [Histoplasma ohiense (nom. inval.)]